MTYVPCVLESMGCGGYLFHEEYRTAMSDLTVAENRMTSIEDRLSELEKSTVLTTNVNPMDNQAVEQAVKQCQHQMLVKLKAIKAAIMAEGGDTATIRQERDAAVAENAALKKEIEKLNYRVRHLIKALDEEESKNQK